jgi:monoamine oxidase
MRSAPKTRNKAMWSRRATLAGGSAALLAGIAPRPAWGRTQADVIIIGAGLAGLYAAQLLEAAGQKIIVIEAENRIGGRLHTLDDLPGRPEAGGVQVGSGYKNLRAIAAELNVGLVPGSNEQRSALYRINGATVAEADWTTSPANHLNETERKLMPAALGGYYAGKLPKLETTQSWMTDTALDGPYASKLKELGASDEAMRLIQANFNGNNLADISTLHIARSIAIFRAGPGPVFTVAGGSQRLPEAMAAAVTSRVQLKTIVTGISEQAGSVEITLAGGKQLFSRHVICTIPFAALRQIKIKANLPSAIKTAISTLPYTQASFAYLSASEPFWKSDGLPETIWTDDSAIGRVFVLGNNPPMLKVWRSGSSVKYRASMSGSDIIGRIEAARPSATGKLKLLRLFNWQNSPFARGIYHHLAPDQGALMTCAIQTQTKRLHFAGEHMAIHSSGMEAALESGQRVAEMLIQLG